MACSFQCLPTELIQAVFSYLDYTSLAAFSASSKACRSLALPELLSTVCFNVWDSGILDYEVAEWSRVLRTNLAHSYVRVLKIDLGTGPPRTPQRSLRKPHLNIGATYQDAEELRTWREDRDCFFWQHKRLFHGNDGGWKNLLPLILELPKLEKINCTGLLIPSHYRDILWQKNPNLRLDMNSFDILSDEEGNVVSSLENLRILSSFSWGLRASGYSDTDEKFYFSRQKKLDQILQVTPHLCKLRLWWKLPLNRLQGITQVAAPAPSLGEGEKFSLVNLNSFHLNLGCEVGADGLEFWARRIDFTKLNVFKLDGPLRPSAFAPTSPIYTLSSLRTLVVNLKYAKVPDDPPKRESLQCLASCLTALAPLVNLRLMGCCSDDVIAAITQQHGGSLQQLWIEPNYNYSDTSTLESGQIAVICQKCIALEDLKLDISRTRGDDTEVSIYKALGEIPTLKRIYLKLDCYNDYHRPRNILVRLNGPTPWFTKFEQWCYRKRRFGREPILCGQVCDFFVNCAMDETLARSVFELISSSKAAGSRPLESLILEQKRCNDAFEGCEWKEEPSQMLRDFQRAYRLERDARNTHRNYVYIKQINNIDDRLDRMFCASDDPKIEVIFRHLWPSEVQDCEPGWWLDTWHSFPLALSNEDKSRMLQASRENPTIWCSL